MHQLKLIALPNIKNLTPQINQYLNDLYSPDQKINYLADAEFIRFNNGEGKCVIKDDVSGCDIFILCDPSNYGIEYDLIGTKHSVGPDEHIQDIKRAISAIGGRAHRINVVMPFLYQGRQDKRKIAESLDCAMLLKELEWYGVKNIITVDAHNISVENAIPFGMSFYNHSMLNQLISKFASSVQYDKLFVVSPDSGASKKADLCAKKLGISKVGTFEKRRNYTVVAEGQNPIEYHKFNGPKTLAGYDILLIDDMIASGNSLISSIKRLKELHASKIHLMTTFSLFTSGLQCFIDAHQAKLFDSLFTTNLSYIPTSYQKHRFIHIVDCSKQIAEAIYNINTNS